MRNFLPLRQPLIYLITKGELTDANFVANQNQTLQTIKIAVQNKIPLVQIREKQLSARLLFKLTAEIVAIAEKSKTKVLVNDRADIALAANAHGVHLTEKSLSATIIRANFPADFIIGVSAHSLEKVLEAKNQQADFAVFSSIFATPNKGEPRGLKVLQTICEAAKPFPIIGLGGINETNYQSVIKVSNGLAAIRFLNETENLRKLGEEFYR